VRNAQDTYLQHIKHNMSIIDRIVAFLAPYECLGCTMEGYLLCPACIQQLPPAPPLPRPNLVAAIFTGTVYGGTAKELVARLKFSGAQAAVRPITDRLLPLLPAEDDILIMPVPTAVRRVRSRGYDQARLIARELSRRSGLAYENCLVRDGHTHQVGASREQRLRQLAGAFRVKDPRSVRGRRILLVDDVMTTGATMERAALVLRKAGADRVSAMVFARVP
jgi:ComF family protein